MHEGPARAHEGPAARGGAVAEVRTVDGFQVFTLKYACIEFQAVITYSTLIK